MDTTTAERLTDLLTRLRADGIDVYLVRVFGNVRDVLTRSGFLDALGPDHVWHSIAAGVKTARAAPPIAVALIDGAALPGAQVEDARVDDDRASTSPRTASTASTSRPSTSTRRSHSFLPKFEGRAYRSQGSHWSLDGLIESCVRRIRCTARGQSVVQGLPGHAQAASDHGLRHPGADLRPRCGDLLLR